MKTIKTDILNRLIPSHMFNICLIDGSTKSTIITLFPSRKNGAYYIDKFNNYLKKFNINIKDYCKIWLNINWPVCPISHEDVGYKISGVGLKLSQFKRGK